jgi:hypothetical protein
MLVPAAFSFTAPADRKSSVLIAGGRIPSRASFRRAPERLDAPGWPLYSNGSRRNGRRSAAPAHDWRAVRILLVEAPAALRLAAHALLVAITVSARSFVRRYLRAMRGRRPRRPRDAHKIYRRSYAAEPCDAVRDSPSGSRWGHTSVATVLILCERHPMPFCLMIAMVIWGALTFGCDNKLEAARGPTPAAAHEPAAPPTVSSAPSAQ